MGGRLSVWLVRPPGRTTPWCPPSPVQSPTGQRGNRPAAARDRAPARDHRAGRSSAGSGLPPSRTLIVRVFCSSTTRTKQPVRAWIRALVTSSERHSTALSVCLVVDAPVLEGPAQKPARLRDGNRVGGHGVDGDGCPRGPVLSRVGRRGGVRSLGAAQLRAQLLSHACQLQPLQRAEVLSAVEEQHEATDRSAGRDQLGTAATATVPVPRWRRRSPRTVRPAGPRHPQPDSRCERPWSGARRRRRRCSTTRHRSWLCVRWR
jgi:hypothetical protein